MAKVDDQDKSASPQIYAGLKFYDKLMAKIGEVNYFSMTGDVNMWVMSLEGYVSLTYKFMSENDKAATDLSLKNLKVRVLNYMTFHDRMGAQREYHYTALRSSLMEAQTKIFGATSALLLKTSEGASDDLDFTKLSRGG